MTDVRQVLELINDAWRSGQPAVPPGQKTKLPGGKKRNFKKRQRGESSPVSYWPNSADLKVVK